MAARRGLLIICALFLAGGGAVVERGWARQAPSTAAAAGARNPHAPALALLPSPNRPYSAKQASRRGCRAEGASGAAGTARRQLARCLVAGHS
jgi:hypothetical protein